jgi:signal transduction histidine kinase
MGNDLLFAAQVEAGSFEIEMDSMRPHELAAESVEAAQPRAAARGIELSLDAEPIPLCTGDGNRIAQAVDNRLSNASSSRRRAGGWTWRSGGTASSC